MDIWDNITDLIGEGVDYVVENPGKTMIVAATVATVAWNPAAWAAVITRIGLTEAAVAVTAATAATVATKAVSKEDSVESYERGKEEGRKVGEYTANQKNQQKMNELMQRFTRYQNLELKIFAMYAVGLAVANADGNISKEKQKELNEFVSGCLAGSFPAHIKEEIAKLTKKPPSLESALVFAKDAKLPKQDIDDIIDLIVNADGEICEFDKRFIAQWQTISPNYEFV